MPETYTDVWVCVDCYFAHHYGASEHERPLSGAETSHYLHGYLDIPGTITETVEGLVVSQWYAGESDTPCDREPLGLWVQGHHLADNTDSETGEGIDEFSWRQCSGCGSTLGGSRYRMAVHDS